MKKLILIDGNSLINRAFYATPLLTSKNGVPTNAVYGFINMLLKLISDDKPEYIAVCFDVHHPTFRHEMYSEYKGTRKPMPEELRPQIPLLKEVLTVMGICCIEKPGFEADDLIGTIAKNTHISTEIFTGDRDSFQLVDDETEVHFTKRGISDVEVYNNADFKEKLGISPWQIVELKALMGDSSDNIPGIPGVGEKTAITLLQKYESVENLYNHTDELTGKLKEKVILGHDSAILSRKLATIDTSVDIPYELEKMTYPLPFSTEARRKFIELDFNKLLSRKNLFEDSSSITANSSALPAFGAANTEAKTDLCETTSGTAADTSAVNTEKTVKRVRILSIDELNKIINSYDKFSVVFETDLILYPITENDSCGTEYFAPVKENLLSDGFNLSEILESVKALFSKNNRLIVYGKKDLMHKLCSLGIKFEAATDDVSLLKYVDSPGKDESLSDAIVEACLTESMPSYSLYRLFETLTDKLKKDNLLSLYSDIELPLADVLFDMEITGFKIDEKALSELSKEYGEELKKLDKEIHDLSGDDGFNINSPKQLGNILFEKLAIPYPKRKKTGSYSTAIEILEGLSDDYPIVEKILEYRKIQKLLSTYIDGFKPLIEKNTGLIHTSFNQTVTTTGRLSSKEPNLQNIPIRDEGKIIRKAFVARDELHTLVGADYSQIELRLLANFSKSESLISAYKKGEDIHAETASQVFDVPLKDVTPEMRKKAKAVNFGVIYGISEYGLAKNLKTSPAVAKDYIKKYFEKYPEVKEYMDKNVAFAHEHGYVETYFKRRRYLPDISSKNFNLRSFSERAAMNMPLQGTSADIIKIAMIRVANRLKSEGFKAKLILQIHDELIIDAPDEEVPAVKKLLTEEMEGAIRLEAPLVANEEVGKTWFDAK